MSEGDNDEQKGRIAYIGDRKVQDGGRFTIPASRYGLDEGDVLELFIETEDGTTFYSPDVQIDTKSRVTIPGHQRRLHGVETGDRIHVEIRPMDDETEE